MEKETQRWAIDLPDDTDVEKDGYDLLEVFMDPDEKYDFEKGFGFVHDGYVYIYRGKLKKNDTVRSASVYQKGKEVIWVNPTDDEAETYSVERIIPLTMDGIYEELTDRANLKDLNPALIEASYDYFAPHIAPEDDILKVLIKRVLEDMKVAVKASKGAENNYDITNLKSNLVKKTSKMSIGYFQKWIGILGLDVEISVRYTDSEGNSKTVRETIE